LAELRIRHRDESDHAEVRTFLANRHSLGVAGVLTFVIGERDCEILTLHCAERLRGTGTALIEAVEKLAADAGCARLWLITTNDNVDALRFYQRRGFRLAALHRGAVDESRARLKPEIPPVGEHGIELRDELELEKVPGA
jgi:GNAT superfamily N-acetyltransferase